MTTEEEDAGSYVDDEPRARPAVVVALVIVALASLVAAVGALVPLPDWLIFTALAIAVVGAVAAGAYAYSESRSSGTPVHTSLWRAFKAIVSFVLSFG